MFFGIFDKKIFADEDSAHQLSLFNIDISQKVYLTPPVFEIINELEVFSIKFVSANITSKQEEEIFYLMEKYHLGREICALILLTKFKKSIILTTQIICSELRVKFNNIEFVHPDDYELLKNVKTKVSGKDYFVLLEKYVSKIKNSSLSAPQKFEALYHVKKEVLYKKELIAYGFLRDPEFSKIDKKIKFIDQELKNFHIKNSWFPNSLDDFSKKKK